MDKSKRIDTNRDMPKDQGDLTVSEAGHKGGQKVKELIEKGKRSESKE